MNIHDFSVPVKDAVLKKNEIRKSVSKNITGEADRILKKPIPDTDYSLFRLYHITGKRADYHQPLMEKRKNLVFLAMAYYLTRKQQYLLKLQDYIWDTCNEPIWSAPAHLPEKLNFDHTYIDLLATSTAAKLAEIYALSCDGLDENIKSRIIHELEKRIFIPFYRHPEDYGWFKRHDSNWCAVCCGNIGVSVILAGRNGVYFEEILDNVSEAIKSYLDNFDTSGGWVEGISYWNYGITNAVKFIDILYRATAGKINLFNHPKLQLAGLFPVHCFLPPDGFVNFGDSHSHALLNRETVLLLSRYTESGKYLSWLTKHIRLRDLEEIITLREIKAQRPKTPEKTFIHFKDIGWVITRKSWRDKDTCVLAVKAGNNGEPHNQIDVGQFIFHVFGEDFLCDHGAGEYTKDYFSPRRYENPFCNAEGHSLIFIDGKGQGIGKEFSGRIIRAEHSQIKDIISIDITAAYPQGLATKIIRTLTLLKKSGYGSLLIEDLVETAGEKIVESRIQFNGRLKKLDRTHLIIEGTRGKLVLNILAPEKLSISVMSFKNPGTIYNTRTDIKFLRLISKSKGSVCFSIEAIPVE